MIPRFIILPLIRQNGQLKFYWQALDLLREIEERYPLLDFLLPLGILMTINFLMIRLKQHKRYLRILIIVMDLMQH